MKIIFNDDKEFKKFYQSTCAEIDKMGSCDGRCKECWKRRCEIQILNIDAKRYENLLKDLGYEGKTIRKQS